MTLFWGCSRHVIQALAVLSLVPPLLAQDEKSVSDLSTDYVLASSACDPAADGLHSDCGSFTHNIVPSTTIHSVGPTQTPINSGQDDRQLSSFITAKGITESLQESTHSHVDSTGGFLDMHPVYIPSPSFLPSTFLTSSSFSGGSPAVSTSEMTPYSESFRGEITPSIWSSHHTSDSKVDITAITPTQPRSGLVSKRRINATLHSLPLGITSTVIYDGLTSALTNSSAPLGSLFTPSRTDDLLHTSVTIPLESPTIKDYRVTMVLGNDCSEDLDIGDSLDSIFQTFPGDPQVLEANASCQRQLKVVISVSVDAGHADSFVREVSQWGKVGNHSVSVMNKLFRVLSAHASPEHRTTNTSEGVDSKPHSILMTTEVIMYIAVGAFFGVVLLVALVICCVKCCRRKPSKMLEMEAVPHVNFCPDDYTLTRIPRPNTICLDYYRGSLLSDHFAPTPSGGSTGEQGIVQPFDTSIVPLEDSRPPNVRQHATGYHLVASPRKMKTFNGKMQRDGSFVNDASITDSTERLHRETVRDRNGVDNVSFTKY